MIKPGSVGGELPAEMSDKGTFDVIIPGDNDDILNHFYRSFDGPLWMKSNVGGIARVVPRNDGILLGDHLTEDDVWAAAVITLRPMKIADVEQITFISNTDISVGLVLGIEYNEKTIGAWRDVNGTRERWTGFDGDDRALTGVISGDQSPIRKTDPVFNSPSDGGAGPLPDVSIEDLQEEFGNISVRVSASIHGPSSVSRQATVQQLEVASAN